MAEQPNIVFLFADQLRPDFLGCYGADFVKTPNIDSIAEAGNRFDRAYSGSPVCVPARASLLTGMNAIRNGVMGNGAWLRPDLAECGIRTWPELLDEYQTAAVGKMHFYPWDARMGFGYRVIAEDKRWINIRDDYYKLLRANGLRKLHGNECPGYQEGKGACVSPIPWEYSVDHFVGRSACEYIETYGRDRPFALMVGFPGPHCPYDPTREFLDAIDPDSVPAPIPAVPADSRRLRERSIRGNRQAWNGVDYSEFTTEDKRRIRTHYAALVTQIDYEVGRILESLDRLGLTENTVIIFAADHGDYLGDHDLIGKGTFYEASTRVPLLVRSPSQFAGGVIHDGLVELGDITATILALAGRKVPDYMDSSPLPGVGAKRSAGRDRVIGMLPGAWMLHDGRYKLAKYETGDVHLFDLDNDPQEQRNLATEPSEAPRVARMDAELTQEIMRSVLDSHFDKNVDPNNDLWSSVEYGFEGRPRKYPAAR